MRNVVVYILLISSMVLAGQEMEIPKVDLKKNLWTYSKPLITPSAFMYLSGACNGLMDLNRNHYNIYSDFFKIENHQWHNPLISWENKYKLDPDTGKPLIPYEPRFFLSTTALVGTTDAWHMYQSGMINFWTGGQISYGINLFKQPKSRRKWYWVVIDVIIQRLAWHAGFHTTYSLVKMKYR